MARTTYSQEVKAAVMAVLLTGQSISQIAKEYHIPEGTIKRWSAQKNGSAKIEPKKREMIGELLIEYLAEALKTIKAQLKVFADERWLLKQPASELAVLHGVIDDKIIRLLEALAKDQEAEDV